MDDWAISSPWAETANDDGFDTFQSPAPPPPVASNGYKNAAGGGLGNGHPPFKAHKEEPFGNGWGFGDHGLSRSPRLQSTDVHTHGGWKLNDRAASPNPDGPVLPSDLSKLKPAKHDWEYKNEWAKSEEDLAPPRASSVWDKSDDWAKPEPPPPVATERPHPTEPATTPSPRNEEPVKSPAPVVPIIDIKTDQPEAPIDTHPPEPPGQLTVDSSVTNLDTRRPSLKTADLEVPSPRATSPRPASSNGDDFGDFEDEDDSADPIEFEEAPTSPREHENFTKREIDVDNLVVDSLSTLDGLYQNKPCQLPAGPGSSEIISTTSQRKTWYKLIRKESARNSIQGEDVLRVRWSGSEVQQKVHDIVKRWISEDRMSGRTMVGSNSGGSFDWNSSPPPTSSGQSNPRSPARSSFPPPKANFSPPTRSSTTATSPASPQSPTFGWNSTQSPQSPGLGWASAKATAGAKPPGPNSHFSSGQNTGGPTGMSAFSIFAQNSTKPASRHTASSSVDLPRVKATPKSARPTSLLVEPSSRSLFGELAAMRSPPAAPVPKPPSTTSNMDFSMFESKPVAKGPQTPINTSFDDDFGDFEGSDFQSPPTPQFPTHVSQPGFQAASPPSQPKTVPPTFDSAASFLASGKPTHPTSSQPAIRSSIDVVFGVPDVAQTTPAANFKTSSPPHAMSQPASDPWGSFDIFDAPKPSQPVPGLAAVGSASSPPTQRLPQQPPGRQNGKSPAFAELKRPALPVLFAKPAIPSRGASKPAEKSDDFDDWGEMIATPASDQQVDWGALSQTPKLSVSSEPETQVRRRSWTLDMFGSPEDNITSANPADLLDKPKPATSTRKVPSPISINKTNNMPTIPATPSPGTTGLFSPGILVPQRVATPTSASHPPSARGSLDASRQNQPTPRNGSFASLNSLSSMGAKAEEPSANMKQFQPPKLQTQPPKPTPSPQPSVSSPLSTEWNDADFGFFEEATPAPKEKASETKSAAGTSSLGHRSTVSLGGMPTQRAGAKLGHAPKGSVTMAPIVGKKDEDVAFKEIIDLLPDMGYMLK